MPRRRMRRDTGALSKSASQADLAPTWKQEVNQRLAAHMRRKSSSTIQLEQPGVVKRGASTLAAEAAARVAAHYAKAPSYSEMLAGEARAAVRAAEAASRAALEAQAAAEFVLAGLEAGVVEEQLWEPEASQARVETGEPARQFSTKTSSQAASRANEGESYGIRWEADLPVRDAASPALVHATHGSRVSETPNADWWESSGKPRDTRDSLWGSEGVEVVEPAQPLHANLIQFPRELVATRKVRPRLADGPHAAAGDAVGQLSIFEVDPGSISTEPAVAEIATEAAWPGLDWSSIKLDEYPSIEIILGDDPSPCEVVLHPASIGLRMMATVVDCSLMVGAFLSAAMVVMERAQELPAMKEIEIGTAVALVAIGVVYQALFFALGRATPGMKWAHISVCTFSGVRPTRAQRCGRLLSLLLSLLPVGLGLAWAIFDEDHLSWHDRLSETYLRKS
jgi:uncharacterized RDD family membrane protein YckC